MALLPKVLLFFAKKTSYNLGNTHFLGKAPHSLDCGALQKGSFSGILSNVWHSRLQVLISAVLLLHIKINVLTSYNLQIYKFTSS